MLADPFRPGAARGGSRVTLCTPALLHLGRDEAARGEATAPGRQRRRPLLPVLIAEYRRHAWRGLAQGALGRWAELEPLPAARQVARQRGGRCRDGL